MSRIVVMDRELHEPLTIVKWPGWALKLGREGHPVMFSVPRDLPTPGNMPKIPTRLEIEHVVMTLESVRNSQGRLLFEFAYAYNPETALLLQAAFLPGQESEVQRREKSAHARGLLQGLDWAFDR